MLFSIQMYSDTKNPQQQKNKPQASNSQTEKKYLAFFPSLIPM